VPPTVSINLCCYNAEKYLKETLTSIVNQTYKDWELIIINDGSSDSTEGIVDEFVKLGYPIIYHSQENHGLGYSRNKALELSKGEFIAFIDQDDLWLPEKMAKQLPLFKDSAVGLVYCDSIFFNERGDAKLLYGSKRYYTGNCFRKLLGEYFLSLETVIIRRSCLGSSGSWFDPRFGMIEEADLFIRIGYEWKLLMVPEPLSKWRVHSESETWKKLYLFAEETEIMLGKYDNLFADFNSLYSSEIRLLKRNVNLLAATWLWRNKQGREARKRLENNLFVDLKSTFLYGITFFPAKQILPLLQKIRGDVIPM